MSDTDGSDSGDGAGEADHPASSAAAHAPEEAGPRAGPRPSGLDAVCAFLASGADVAEALGAGEGDRFDSEDLQLALMAGGLALSRRQTDAVVDCLGCGGASALSVACLEAAVERWRAERHAAAAAASDGGDAAAARSRAAYGDLDSLHQRRARQQRERLLTTRRRSCGVTWDEPLAADSAPELCRRGSSEDEASSGADDPRAQAHALALQRLREANARHTAAAARAVALHAVQGERARRRLQKRGAEIAAAMLVVLRATQGHRRTEGRSRAERMNRTEMLYKDAAGREERREERRTAEAQKASDAEEQRLRKAPGAGRKRDSEIFTRLYQERDIRSKNRADTAQRFDQERELAELPSRRPKPKHLRHVMSRWREPPMAAKRSQADAPASDATPPPAAAPADDRAKQLLAAVAAAVATRCGRQADVAALGPALAPVAAAAALFRHAAQASDRQSEGVGALRAWRPRRLHAEGLLIEDVCARRRGLEPHPIRQLNPDLPSLLEAAAMAQAELLALVCPAELGDAWPQGEKRLRPGAVPEALFAVNPGPKTRHAAEAKARVRFAPADRGLRYRGLCDLARAGLVFADCRDLLRGLERVLDTFRVLHVRNTYADGSQSSLGWRWVEVLVVSEDGLPEPHVCELRLEEMSFYSARTRSESHLDEVRGAFVGAFGEGGGGASDDAIAQLVTWSLLGPRPSQAVSRLRRRLVARYGSAVNAWRHAAGDAAALDFVGFRTLCNEFRCEDKAVELWEALDSGMSGTISLFDLDPEACASLAKLYARVGALLRRPVDWRLEHNGTLLSRVASAAGVRLRSGSCMEEAEFRGVCRAVGFDDVDEVGRLFRHLDDEGGPQCAPPAMLTERDFLWLNRLPLLVDLSFDMLVTQEALAATVADRRPDGKTRAASPRGGSSIPRPPLAHQLRHLAAPEAPATGKHARSSAPAMLLAWARHGGSPGAESETTAGGDSASTAAFAQRSWPRLGSGADSASDRSASEVASSVADAEAESP